MATGEDKTTPSESTTQQTGRTSSALDRYLVPGLLLSQAITGLAGGLRAGADRQRQAELDQYSREAAARALQMQWVQSLLGQEADRATAFADRSPLGAELGFVQRQNLLGQLGRSTAAMPQPAGYGGISNPFIGMDLTPYGMDATAQALAERRKALALIEPNFQFGSLGAYGLSGPGTVTAEEQVARQARSAAEQRAARETAMTNLLNAQYTAATAGQGEQPQQKKGGGFWRTLGRIGLAAAPIVASAFGGPLGSLVGRAVVGGLSGIGQSRLSGAGWGQSLLSGGLGAATGAMTPSAGVRGPGEAVGAAVKRAVLNPRALTTIGSAALPDQARMVAQAITPMLNLPGPTLYRRPMTEAQTMALAQGPQAPTQNLPYMPSRQIPIPIATAPGLTQESVLPTVPSPTVRAIAPTETPAQAAQRNARTFVSLPGLDTSRREQPAAVPQPQAVSQTYPPLSEQEALAIYNSPYFNQLILMPQVKAQLAEYTRRKAAERQQSVSEAIRGASMAGGGR